MVQFRFLGALIGAILLGGCQREAAPPAPAPQTTETSQPSLPIVEAPLDRKALLNAVAEMSSAFSLGRNNVTLQRELAGKRIEMRLRIGCPGDVMATRSIDYRLRDRRLLLTVEPEITLQSEAVASLGIAGVEAVEGFWINRPWLLESGCPALAPTEDPVVESDRQSPAAPATLPPATVASAGQQIGIARFFTETDTRSGRRTVRNYQVSQRLAEGEEPSAEGYELVLLGRLEELADGRVIACSGEATSEPPNCIVSAHLDRVMIVNPITGAVLGEWTTG